MKKIAFAALLNVLNLTDASAPTDMLLPALNQEQLSNQTILLARTAPEEAYREKMTVVATAYSSTVDQTDADPFITASGKHVRDGIVAANFLPFGTQIRIPKHFGNRVLTVEDRMHQRFSDRIDIWFPDRQSALEFGKRKVEIEIL